jgi:hypothetical protein
MANAPADFRTFAFDPERVNAAGRDVGGKIYWKLYAIENLVRVIVHSVLSVQIGPNWWLTAVDPGVQRQVAGRMAGYGKQPWYSTPGKHEVYYIYLSDLTKILTANSGQFKPLIPDIDLWTARLEMVRSPRNIVGHMNWLTKADRTRIDTCHHDVLQLVGQLAADKQIPLTIP